MNLATYFAGTPRIGVVEGDEIWDLERLYSLYLFETERIGQHAKIAEACVPGDMAMFIRLNHRRMAEYRDALAFARENRALFEESAASLGGLTRPVAKTRLLPAVLNPTKVICAGNSYRKYLIEQNLPLDEWPQDVKISFFKSPTALIGHGETIRFPPDTTEWDYENELTIVVGRPCRDISPDEADDYIFGYTILNDACVRDVPKWSGRYDSPRGKACDTFAPLGPWIVPRQFLAGDPNDLRFRTWIDDELRQDGRTSGLLWPVQRILAFVSRYIALSPGDVISTGSGSGNALTGPGDYMRAGQVVRCEIDGIGTIANPVGLRRWTSHLPPLPPLS